MIKNLSVIIATYNEEIHLERLLKQISNKVKNIYIIDSYSTDKTIGIAKKYNRLRAQMDEMNIGFVLFLIMESKVTS